MSNTIKIIYRGETCAIPYQVIRSGRKTCSLSLDRNANLVFRVPFDTDNEKIAELAREKSRWIIKHYQKALTEIKNRPVSNLTGAQRAALEMKYRDAAHSYIPKRTAFYQRLTGGTYQRVCIRDQKTRWGSCSSKGTLSFNWRLILAPSDVLDYVIVHELCHLTHMNHSPEFWAAVEAVCPDYRTSRKWLKDHGRNLVI